MAVAFAGHGYLPRSVLPRSTPVYSAAQQGLGTGGVVINCRATSALRSTDCYRYAEAGFATMTFVFRPRTAPDSLWFSCLFPDWAVAARCAF